MPNKSTNNFTFLTHSAVKVEVWWGDDDTGEKQVFSSKLEEGLADTQDQQSTVNLCQHSADKTTLVSQNSLKLR